MSGPNSCPHARWLLVLPLLWHTVCIAGVAICLTSGPSTISVNGALSLAPPAACSGLVNATGASLSAQWVLNNITLSAGAQVTLSCLTLSSVTLGPPTLTSFAQPLGLQLVPPAARQMITLADVVIVTDCPTVVQYQAYVCGLNMSFLTGAVEIQTPSWMFVHSWRSDAVQLRNVNLTCTPPASLATSTAAPAVACLATAVGDGPSLLAAVIRLQQKWWPQGAAVTPTPAQRPHILVVVTQSIQLTRADVAPYWPQGAAIYGLVTIAAPPGLNVVFDWGNLIDTMYVQLGAFLTLSGFLMVNLAGSYAPPVTESFHLFGCTQNSLFAVRRAQNVSIVTNNSSNSSTNATVRLMVQASTMVVAFDSFAVLCYNTPALYNYWVVQDAVSLTTAARKASVIQFTATQGAYSDPNHLKWADADLGTLRKQNVTLANPTAYPLLTVQTFGYLNLTYNNGTPEVLPPPVYFQVMSLTDIWHGVQYTYHGGQRFSKLFGQTIVVCANMSGNSQAWEARSSLYPWPTYAPFVVDGLATPPPPAGLTGSVELAATQASQAPLQPPSLPLSPPAVNVIVNITLPAVIWAPTTFTTWVNTVVCWDVQQAPALIAANASAPVIVRLMSFLNLPPHTGVNTMGSDPTLRMVSALWSFHTIDASGSAVVNSSIITLDRVTLHVPPAEMQLFLSLASLPLPKGARHLTVNGTAVLQRAIVSHEVSSHGADWIYYSTISTLRWRGTDVNITSAVPSACSDYQAMAVSTAYQDITAASSADGFPAWAIGLIAGLGGAALLAAALATLLVRRSRQHARRDSAKDILKAGRAVGPGCVAIACEKELARAVQETSLNDDFSGSFTGSGTFNMIDSLQELPATPGSPAGSSRRICPEALAQAYTNENLGVRDEQLQILGVLGRGGHGIVYRGTWKGLPVAAKVMIVHEEKTEMARRQMLEATLSTSLSHPNIVNTYSYDLTRLVLAATGSASGLPECASGPTRAASSSSLGSFAGAAAWQLLIVQELCSGGTMRKMIDGQDLVHAKPENLEPKPPATPGARNPNLEHVLQLALDVALGLEHLHSKNVVHSDINPNNVLLQASIEPRAAGLTWTAKVADFGLSVAFDEGKSHASKVYAGTPYYIAPETQSQGLLSKASDVFAFGILLSEMMTGRSSLPCAIPSSALPMAPPSVTSFAEDSARNTRAGAALSPDSGEIAPAGLAWPAASSGSTTFPPVAEDTEADTPDSSGYYVHIAAASDFAALALHRGSSAASAASTMQPMLGGGGGCFGAARMLPPLPPTCPPQYCELVADCLNPVAGKRPTIEAVCRRLRLVSCEHVPGFRGSQKARSTSGSVYELASASSAGQLSGVNASPLVDGPPRVKGKVARRASMPSLLGRTVVTVERADSICENSFDSGAGNEPEGGAVALPPYVL